MKNHKGFTLVEVIIASMLLGMVFLAAFPFMSTGYQLIKKERIKTEAQVVGDRVFDRMIGEIQNVGMIHADAHEEDDFYEESIVDSEFSKLGFDIETAAEPMEDHWIHLTVILKKDEEIVYQRTEMSPLLNSAFLESMFLEVE